MTITSGRTTTRIFALDVANEFATMGRYGEFVRHSHPSVGEGGRLGAPRSTQPTEVELQILRILWQTGGATARQVHNGLAADQAKSTNYSTTVKMLSVMLDKGLVKRDELRRRRCSAPPPAAKKHNGGCSAT